MPKKGHICEAKSSPTRETNSELFNQDRWDLMSRSVGACLLTLRPGARAPRNKKQVARSAAKLRAGTLFLLDERQ